MNKAAISIFCVASWGVACGPEPTESGQGPEAVTADAMTAAAGAAAPEESEFRIRRTRGGRVVDLYRGAAEALYGLLGEAGIPTETEGSASYRLGTYLGCVVDDDGSYCQIVDRSASTQDGDFALTIHGRRFGAGSSELFGVLAAAEGIAPSSVSYIESDRFVCARNGNSVWCGLTPLPAEDEAELALRLIGLDPVGPDYVYEGWLITSNGAIPSGRFDVTEADESFSFRVSREIAEDSSQFVLTIEPAVGDDPAPASTHVVAGDFGEGAASLSVGHASALGDDFSAATGSFLLGTPSSPGGDYRLGIWFVNPAAGPGPSLSLPQLPAGWVYEGWVAGPAGPVSTGRFVDAAMADDDAGGPTAGSSPTPPFPGQDFINPPVDLVGLNAVITVEPEPDPSPGPFAIKPLIAPIEDRGGGVLQMMANQAEVTNPRGFATLFDAEGRPLE